MSGPQDHNGFTHQDPGFIDHVVNKKAEVVRVYLPPDANCLLSVMDHCLRSRHYVNVVIAGKHPAPQWLTMDAPSSTARKASASGRGRATTRASRRRGHGLLWRRAHAGDARRGFHSARASAQSENPGGQRRRPHEATAATEHPHGLSDMDFDELFTKDKPVIFAFMPTRG